MTDHQKQIIAKSQILRHYFNSDVDFASIVEQVGEEVTLLEYIVALVDILETLNLTNPDLETALKDKDSDDPVIWELVRGLKTP